MNLRDFSLLFLVCSGWAAHTIISKIVVSGMQIPPLYYASIRYGVIAVCASAWIFPCPNRDGASNGRWGICAFLHGPKTSTPSSSAVVQQLGLPMTTVLSIALLGKKLRWKRYRIYSAHTRRRLEDRIRIRAASGLDSPNRLIALAQMALAA